MVGRDTTQHDVAEVDDAEPQQFDIDQEQPSSYEEAVFGMGCFWSPDAYFGVREGVIATMVGYAGGEKTDPTYRELGDHTEVVRVLYDPETVSYETLLEQFVRGHDPGRKQKTQYRSLVLATNSDQRDEAKAFLDGMNVETVVESLERFYLAENYHQKYRLQHAPSLKSFLFDTYSMPELMRSTVAARLNGFVAGWGKIEDFDECDCFDLDDELEDTVRKLFFRNKNIRC